MHNPDVGIRDTVQQHLNCLRWTSWSTTSAGRANRSALKALATSHAGKRCFIIGNGPSLLQCNTSLMRNEVTIGSNNLYLHFDAMGFQPTYYTVEDRLMADQRKEDYRKITKSVVFVPYDLKDIIVQASNILYINFVRHYRKFPKFSHDFHRRSFWGGTISYLNLQLARYLGCNPIFLVGFDHSWNYQATSPKETILKSSFPADNFTSDYYRPGEKRWNPKPERMELAYKHAKQVLDSRGVTVLNATEGGRLEVFQRTNYTDLFK